ncbi:MAG: hypothetical protein AB7S26_20955 [Sandaracinaceae bacterium]
MTAALLCACTAPTPSEPPRVEALVLASVDPETGAPRLELAEVELSRVDDLDTLSGDWFQTTRAGGLRAQIVGATLVNSTFEGGDPPSPRYRLDDRGVATPRDYDTLAMFSTLDALETVFEALDETTGLDPDVILAPYGPIDVIYEPRLEVERDGMIQHQIGTTNAYFDSSGPRFAVLRRSAFEGEPLAIDRRVLAHETGHFVFFLSFFSGADDGCDPDAVESNLADPFFAGRFEWEYALAGINEGFADLVAFAITGTVDVLAGVFPAAEGQSITTQRTIRLPVACDDGAFYCIGTTFARSAYDAFLATGGDPLSAPSRRAFVRSIVDALRDLPATMRERGLVPAATGVVAECMVEPGLTDVGTQVLSAFLDALLSRLDEPTRTALCPALIDHFGERFLVAARTECS